VIFVVINLQLLLKKIDFHFLIKKKITIKQHF